MKKATAQASSDVALIKYWGKKDETLRLPENSSVSIILEGLNTTTTVEFGPSLTHDVIKIQGESDEQEIRRVVKHLDRIRMLAKTHCFAKVESENIFPKCTGLSSSGSGFAALTIAATNALGLHLSQCELSILARQGSGTACRCICEGFVEWKVGDSDQSHAETIFPSHYWDIRDVVATVDIGNKKVSSTEGHKTASTSPFFTTRLGSIPKKIEMLKKYIKNRDFIKFGELVEAEALEFHSILLTSTPSLIAWYPGTIDVINLVKEMRNQGIKAYFTINTGFNVHVLTLPRYESSVVEILFRSSFVRDIIRAKVGKGPHITSSHLF